MFGEFSKILKTEIIHTKVSARDEELDIVRSNRPQFTFYFQDPLFYLAGLSEVG